MLGRDAVAERGSLGQVAGEDDRAVIAPAGPGDGGAGQGGQDAVHGGDHGLRQGRVGGHQDRLRVGVVFGLRQQVQRQPVGMLGAVGDHQHLGGAGDAVDAYPAEDLPFRRRDIGVARPGDLVDRAHGFGAIGHRRDRLRAADAPDFIDAGDAAGEQHQRVDLAARGRHADRQPRHPGHPRRDRVHQDRGRIAGLAARHIQPRRRDRRPAPAEFGAGLVGPQRVGRHLAGVIGADALGREFQRGAVPGRDARTGGVDLGGGEAQPVRGQVGAVEAVGQLDQRRVAARPDLGDDPGDHVADIGGILALGRQHGGETRLEIGIGGGQGDGHERSFRLGRGVSGWGPGAQARGGASRSRRCRGH